MHMNTAERLLILSAAASDLASTVSDTIRFGFGALSKESLEEDIHHLMGVIYGMEEAGELDCDWRRGASVAWSSSGARTF